MGRSGSRAVIRALDNPTGQSRTRTALQGRLKLGQYGQMVIRPLHKPLNAATPGGIQAWSRGLSVAVGSPEGRGQP